MKPKKSTNLDDCTHVAPKGEFKANNPQTPFTKSLGEKQRGKIVNGLETGHIDDNTSDVDNHSPHLKHLNQPRKDSNGSAECLPLSVDKQGKFHNHCSSPVSNHQGNICCQGCYNLGYKDGEDSLHNKSRKICWQDGYNKAKEEGIWNDKDIETAHFDGMQTGRKYAIEDIEKIIGMMGEFKCGYMDGETCDRIDREEMIEKLKKLRGIK
jgi:hypothetical protein